MLGAIGNQTVNEGTMLSFTATATDADLPREHLTYSLTGAPAGAPSMPDRRIHLDADRSAGAGQLQLRRRGQ